MNSNIQKSGEKMVSELYESKQFQQLKMNNNVYPKKIYRWEM